MYIILLRAILSIDDIRCVETFDFSTTTTVFYIAEPADAKYFSENIDE